MRITQDRKIYLFMVTAFCLAVISYAVLMSVDSRVSLLAVEASFWTLFACTAGYVFGANIESIGFLRSGYANAGLAGRVISSSQTKTENIQILDQVSPDSGEPDGGVSGGLEREGAAVQSQGNKDSGNANKSGKKRK